MTPAEMRSMLEALEAVRLEAIRLKLGWRVTDAIVKAKSAIAREGLEQKDE